MKVIFDDQESSIVGYKEISADFDAFDFSNKMIVEPGRVPRMIYHLTISGDGLKIKAE
jgi:hypothetical protein